MPKHTTQTPLIQKKTTSPPKQKSTPSLLSRIVQAVAHFPESKEQRAERKVQEHMLMLQDYFTRNMIKHSKDSAAKAINPFNNPSLSEFFRAKIVRCHQNIFPVEVRRSETELLESMNFVIRLSLAPHMSQIILNPLIDVSPILNATNTKRELEDLASILITSKWIFFNEHNEIDVANTNRLMSIFNSNKHLLFDGTLDILYFFSSLNLDTILREFLPLVQSTSYDPLYKKSILIDLNSFHAHGLRTLENSKKLLHIYQRASLCREEQEILNAWFYNNLTQNKIDLTDKILSGERTFDTLKKYLLLSDIQDTAELLVILKDLVDYGFIKTKTYTLFLQFDRTKRYQIHLILNLLANKKSLNFCLLERIIDAHDYIDHLFNSRSLEHVFKLATKSNIPHIIIAAQLQLIDNFQSSLDRDTVVRVRRFFESRFQAEQLLYPVYSMIDGENNSPDLIFNPDKFADLMKHIEVKIKSLTAEIHEWLSRAQPYAPGTYDRKKIDIDQIRLLVLDTLVAWMSSRLEPHICCYPARGIQNRFVPSELTGCRVEDFKVIIPFSRVHHFLSSIETPGRPRVEPQAYGASPDWVPDASPPIAVSIISRLQTPARNALRFKELTTTPDLAPTEGIRILKYRPQ